MLNIIEFPKTRSLSRKSGERFRIKRKDDYEVWIHAILPVRGRKKVERRLYGQGFHLVQCLGGFRLTKGFTIDMIRSEEWHRLPHRVRPDLLRDFLEAMDDCCEQELFEIEIEGQLMAKSHRSVAKA